MTISPQGITPTLRNSAYMTISPQGVTQTLYLPKEFDYRGTVSIKKFPGSAIAAPVTSLAPPHIPTLYHTHLEN
jgi:hypothetical protein